MSVCHSSDRSDLPYGADPVFLTTSDLYNGRLTATDYYSSDEIGTSTPYGFFHVQAPAEEDSGFHAFLDINLDNSRASQALQYLQDGFWIDDKTARWVLIVAVVVDAVFPRALLHEHVHCLGFTV